MIAVVRIACCQIDIAWEEKAFNCRRAEDLLANARLPAGTLAILPEMFATGFSMNVAKIAEEADSETRRFLAALAKKLDINILAGVASRRSDGRGRNLAIAISSSGELLATYQKMHPFSFAAEDRYYEPGESVATIALGGLQICPLICYDLRFPEVFRAGLRHGANCFAVIANWPAERQAHWVALLKARAIENQAYVAGINRCGSDPSHKYAGQSLIIDPQGKILAEAADQEAVIWAEAKQETVEEYRLAFPVLTDIRPTYPF